MEGDIAEWGQQLVVLATAVIGIFIGIYKYIKTESTTKEAVKEQSSSTSVVAASFIDSRTLKELIDTLREVQEESERENRKSTRAMSDLKQSIDELCEHVRLQTESNHAAIRYLNRQAQEIK